MIAVSALQATQLLPSMGSICDFTFVIQLQNIRIALIYILLIGYAGNVDMIGDEMAMKKTTSRKLATICSHYKVCICVAIVI